MHDSSDDLLQRMVARLARELADEKLENPKYRTAARDELIVSFCEAGKSVVGNKMREVIVPAVANYFGVSEKTVWNARAAMKRKKLQP